MPIVGLAILASGALVLKITHRASQRPAVDSALPVGQQRQVGVQTTPIPGSVTASITKMVASAGRFHYTVTIENSQPQSRVIWKHSIRDALVTAKVIMPDGTSQLLGANDPCLSLEQMPPIRYDLVEVPAGGSVTCEMDLAFMLNPRISAYLFEQSRIRIEVSGSIIDRPARLTFPLEFAGEIMFSRK